MTPSIMNLAQSKSFTGNVNIVKQQSLTTAISKTMAEMRTDVFPPDPDYYIVVIDYTNYRGERSTRRIVPRRIWFGDNDYHKSAQWILRAYDLDKQADRDFALKDVHSWTPE